MPPAISRVLLPVFAAAIFLSAALIFAVQPMFTKMVLPKLGGSPSVWSVAMVFFQTMLLAGYAYAHLIVRRLPGRVSVVVHLVVTAAATVALPLAIASSWGRPPEQGAAFWLIGLFAVSIGLPFFALSANGPLLQAWFARTDHPAAKDPYFLYAASNIGSFLALIVYPFALEPFTRLGDQTRGWSVLFVVLILLIAACGVLMLRFPRAAPADGEPTEPHPAPTWRDAAKWTALAAVPSGLLVAVTAHLSTDVAAVPLLWVVPLALYLFTFVIVFQTRPIIPHRIVVLIEPAFIVALAGVLVYSVTDNIALLILLNVVAFFVIALACHGELAGRRPAPEHLTAFYMWMSVGGMIGGLFAGLVAPNVFSWIVEYPVLIVLAALFRPGLSAPTDWRAAALWAVAVAAVALVMVPGWLEVDLGETFNPALGVLLVAGFALSFWRNPLPFAAAMAMLFIVHRVYEPDVSERETLRSFFGVHKIYETSDGSFRVLMHGTTIHGAEKLPADGETAPEKPAPLTYYHADAPLAHAVAAARERRAGPIKVAVVGLGTGSLACYVQAGDAWRYFEIDPMVVRIARDPERFSYLAKCAPDVPIVIGDARLTLADDPGRYDLIVVDAFSSDTVPAHLLTREAMAVYLSKLAPGGIVAMHVSNRHLELSSVVAGIARANGMVTRANPDDSETADDDAYKFTSSVVAAARKDEDFGTLATTRKWTVTEPDPKQWVWTDDYTNVVGAIIRNMKGE